VAASGSPKLSEALRTHLSTAESGLNARRATLRAARGPLDEQRRDVESALQQVRDASEEPPAAPVLWARRERPQDNSGAPFWACVQPRDLNDEQHAVLEAALAASGLLDAWLTPDGTLVTASETVLTASTPVPENLLAVLEPTPAGGVEGHQIATILSGIGWFTTRPAGQRDFWFAADGHWQIGALTGFAEPAQPASYLGATAREQARLRTIARLEAELAEVWAALDEIDRQLSEIADALQRLAEERRSAPNENALIRITAQAEAVRKQFEKAQSDLVAAQKDYDGAAAERDKARAIAASYAAEHGFPLDELGAVREALNVLLNEINRLEGELKFLSIRQGQVTQAEKAYSKAVSDEERARKELADARDRARRAEIAAQTAYKALGTGHQAQLSRRKDLDSRVESLESQVERLATTLGDLRVQENTAARVLEEYEQARKTAEERRDSAIDAWWEAADRGLVAPLGVAVSDGRSVDTTLEAARAVRRDILPAGTDAAAQDRAWRRCFEELQKLRQCCCRTGMGQYATATCRVS
jgi:hypothetical protein